MADGTTEPKRGGNGSWWTTLQGVLTAIAGLLTAVAGLVVALHQADLLHWPRGADVPEMPSETLQSHTNGKDKPALVVPSPGPAKVEGVMVKIIEVRRFSQGDTTLVELDYEVTSGSNYYYSRHDPARFVRLLSDGRVLEPFWVSASATDLPLEGKKDFSVRFQYPASALQALVFRFGEEHYVRIEAKVSD
jgi:hypothetical protein